MKFIGYLHLAGNRLLETLMVVSGVSLAGLMFLQVILREAGSAFLGFEEATALLGLWCYFSGFAYATVTNSHIGGGLEQLFVKSQRTRVWHAHAIVLASAILMSFFAWQAFVYFQFNSSTGRVSTYLHWPRGLWSASVLFGLTYSALVLWAKFARLFSTNFWKRQKAL